MRDRLGENVAHGQRAEVAMDLEQPAHQPRHRHRAETDVKFLGDAAEIGEDGSEIETRLGQTPRRRVDEKIVDPWLLPGRMREQKAAAPGRAQHRLDDARNRERGQRRIEGVAARAQHFCSCLGGQRMSGGDHAAWLSHAQSVCGLSRVIQPMTADR